jgi:hypothetical protein
MSPFLGLVFSIFLASGFYLFGEIILKLLRIENIIKKISNPIFQNASIGISFFLFLIYPIFFIVRFDEIIFKFTSYFFLILGIFNFYHNFNYLKEYFNKILIILNSKNYLLIYVLIFIFLYFFYSLSPITSADSVAYHTTVAKDLLKNGPLAIEAYNFNSLLTGSGEFLNAFAISIGAFQFTSFVHFLGLISILNLISSFSKRNNVSENNQILLIILVISCPVLIFLIGSSKPQFFYTSSIFLSYTILLNVKDFKLKDEILKSFFLSFILCIISVQAKITFSISFFLIILGYLLIFRNYICSFKIFLLCFVIFSFSFLTVHLWKQDIFNYSFYKFFFNPLPLNIPGISDYNLRLKQLESERFPLSLLFPNSISYITTNLGFGILIIFFLIKENFRNKNFYFFCLIFFFITFSLVGQKSPRFYLEIYLLSVLLFIFVINKSKNNILFNILKKLVYFQSFYVLIILVYGTFILFPGSLTKNLNHQVLSKYSYGYNLYHWVNTVLPSESTILTNHRGHFYSKPQVIYADFIFDVPYSNSKGRLFFLEEIKKKKPRYILFYNFKNNFNYLSYDFRDCVNELYTKSEEVGFHESRNPFNSIKEKYNAYIFIFDYKKLPGCVKKN